MLRSRMFWNLFAACCFLIFFSVGLLGFVVSRQVERNEVAEVEQRLRHTALLLRELLQDHEAKNPLFQRLVKVSGHLNLRLTLIDRKGRVLLESDQDPEAMDNHLERPEFTQARFEEVGTSKRHSQTLGQDMMYLALRVDHNASEVGFLRVAMPLTKIRELVASLQRLVWLATGLTALLALGAAFWLTRRMTRPLEQLAEGAQQIATGAYGHKVVLTRADEMGQLAHSFNDMSERLARQFAQLDEDRQQLRTVLSSMEEGVVAVDNEQHILFANERAAQLLDFPTRQPTHRRLWELVRFRSMHDVVHAAMASNEPVQKEVTLGGPNGRTLLVHAARLPGLPSRGLLLVLHDNTKLRRLERVRQEFVANVSHELKTPLAVIQACVETLIDGVDDQMIRGQFLERISDQAQRLHNLILDLLRLARIESETEAFSMEELPLDETVRESIDRHRTLAQGRGQRLEAAPPPTEGLPITIWADEEAMRQILDNLIDNALKYTPDGGQVEVSWGIGERGIFVRVKDTGIGISDNDLPRIFERFYRVDKARSRELGGTGLGLAIVKHLAQAMHGIVEAESRIGEGSCFTIYLPSAGARDVNPSLLAKAVPPMSASGFASGG